MLKYFAILLIALAMFIGISGCAKKDEPDVSSIQEPPAAEVEEDRTPEEPIPNDEVVVENNPAEIEEPTEAKPEPPVKCDNPAPSFTLGDLNGKPVSLSDFAGKVVILDFWAIFCRPCIMEIPSFIELQKKYRESGLVVVGISLDRDPRTLPGFVKKMGINYTILANGHNVAMAYGNVTSIPTTFIIDRSGCVKHRVVGVHSYNQFDGLIKPLIEESVAVNTTSSKKAL